MIHIYDGRTHFFQWDKDQKLIIRDSTVSEVHFSNRTDEEALVCETYEYNGFTLVDVPNILLQNHCKINVFVFDGSATKYKKTYEVYRRAKPADYIYTETEVKRYEDLEKRIKALEDKTNSGGGSVDLSNYFTKDEVLQETANILETSRYHAENEVKIALENYYSKEDLSEQVNNINSTDFSLYDAEYQNGYIGGDGTLKKLASYRITNLVHVKKGLKIKYKLKHATVSPIIGLYSSNSMGLKNFIGRVEGFNGVSEGEYIVPSDGYICFVTLESYKEGYVIFDNSIFDGIKDYVKGYVNNKVEVSDNLNLNILCLGDSIFGNDGEIVTYLAQFTGSNVINGAIGGTRASIRVSNTDAFQYLDGQNIIQALTSGNWTNQDSAVSALTTYSSWLPSRVETLKSIDLSKIDLVIMDWGTNDYAGGQTLQTIISAYNEIIDSLQSAYPELRILITTPIWRYFDDVENGDNKIFADSTLQQIVEAIETFAKEKRVHVLNAYQNMPLNYNTATTFFDTDSGVHLNNKGNKVYAHLLNGKIRSLY